jgi:hypothetical protein
MQEWVNLFENQPPQTIEEKWQEVAEMRTERAKYLGPAVRRNDAMIEERETKKKEYKEKLSAIRTKKGAY